ncbi:MAG: hypothetical protein JWR10_4454 [Rubritepida sp.]|nr:hypothetical protein [Rubritepida sp.]
MPVARIELGLAAGLIAAACLAFGGALGRAARLELKPELAVIIGLVGFGYAIALPARFWGVDLRLPAACFCALAIALMFWRPSTPRPMEVPALIALLAAGGFALAWSLEISARFAEFEATGLMRLWSDVFIHAGSIAEFGDLRSIGRGSSTLVDVPGGFYHFVSFALPGLAVSGTGVPAITTISGLWLPVGVLAMAMGVFALGRGLAGVAGGAAALVLLAALPDSAGYGLRQGFLSFHWLLETAPGSAYGLACALASLALLAEVRGRAWMGPLVLSAVMLCAIFLLRAQIFIWLAVPWAVGVVAAAPFVPRRWKGLLISLGSLASIAALLAVSRGAIAAQGLIPYLDQYFEVLRSLEADTPYHAVATAFREALGPAGALLPGIILAWAGFGLIPLVGFLIGLWLAWRRGLTNALDLVPLAALLWSGVLMLLAPAPLHGDITEFRQRGFLLVTLLLTVWLARWVVILWPAIARSRPLALAACAAGLVTWHSGAEWKAPRMAWAQSYRSVQVPLPVIAAAHWLRVESGPSGAFALSAVDTAAMLTDEGTMLAALSGVPAFLARAGIHRLGGVEQAATVAEREAILREIAAAPRQAEAMERLRALRIGYYVVLGEAGPAWDPSRASAAYQTPGVAIYRTAP